jgi:hypothetical protein
MYNKKIRSQRVMMMTRVKRARMNNTKKTNTLMLQIQVMKNQKMKVMMRFKAPTT